MALNPQRRVYVHVVQGQVQVNGHVLQGGDALLGYQETELDLSQGQAAEVLVFDLAN